MSRGGNPYDNAKAESFMKTLRVEAVYNRRRLHSPLGHLSSEQIEDQHARPTVKAVACRQSP
jgi:putative transposase